MDPIQYKKGDQEEHRLLAEKCEDYSNLRDIEVALYISFPEEEGFVSYESTDLRMKDD